MAKAKKDPPILISIYMHKTQAFHPMQMEAIAKHTHRSYHLQLVNQPGTVHQNINRALDWSYRTKDIDGSQYLFLLDDDCILLEDNWAEKVIRAMQATPQVAMMTVPEMKNMRSVRAYKAARVPKREKVYLMPWLPGYFLAIDMDKVPSLKADENIPHAKGMSDLDLSLQVLARGWCVGMYQGMCVYHPYKGPCTAEHDAEYDDQSSYMIQKWGIRYRDAKSRQVSTMFDEDLTGEKGLKEDEEDFRSRPDYSPDMSGTISTGVGLPVSEASG